MKYKPLDDLEMFELLRAAYPEKFKDDADDTWVAAQQFADEITGWREVADLLGRVAMLTMPVEICANTGDLALDTLAGPQTPAQITVYWFCYGRHPLAPPHHNNGRYWIEESGSISADTWRRLGDDNERGCG